MLTSLLLISAILLYLVATVLTAQHVRSVSNADDSKDRIKLSFKLASLAMLLHLALAYQTAFINGSLNISLASMSVLVSAIVVVVFIFGGLVMPIRRLGIMVFPITIACLLFSIFWQSEATTLTNQSMAFSTHILVSILAYALLTIATVQALLYVYQERQIKLRANPAMLMALPPLQTMEQLLFRLISVGFGLLTLTLLSGALFSQQIFGHAFEFKHHTVLALLGWLVFATLLIKRAKHGLRGALAASWTFCGFLLIQLGYFGTKFVSESLTVQ